MTEQRDYSNPYIDLPRGRADYLRRNAAIIPKLLVYNAAIMPTGVLRFCLEYAESKSDNIGGVFKSIRQNFRDLRGTGLPKLLDEMYDFRNTYVAHQNKELKDAEEAREALKKWIDLTVWLEGLCAAQSSD